MAPAVIAATPQESEANGSFFAPPEFVRHSALIADLAQLIDGRGEQW